MMEMVLILMDMVVNWFVIKITKIIFKKNYQPKNKTNLIKMIVKISAEEERELLYKKQCVYAISPNLLNNSNINEYLVQTANKNLFRFKPELTAFEMKKILETKIIIKSSVLYLKKNN